MAKRDLDRIRQILLHLEAQPSNDGFVWTRNDGFFVPTDDYQFSLMAQAGFITGHDYRTLAAVVPDRVSISYSGHDYIDAIRNESIWQQTKAAVAETGGSATFEIIKTLATGFIKKKLSQHTGIEI